VAEGAVIHLVGDDGQDGGGGHHAIVWGEPVLQRPRGELSWLDMPGEQATSRLRSVSPHRVSTERELLLGGRPIDCGLLVRTRSVIRLRVPAGYDRLVAEWGFEGPARARSLASVARRVVYRETRAAAVQSEPERDVSSEREPSSAQKLRPSAGLSVSVPLGELGFARAVRARGAWSGQTQRTFETVFARTLPWHGAGLFRLSRRERSRVADPTSAPGFSNVEAARMRRRAART
jgi:alpha-galactosidase